MKEILLSLQAYLLGRTGSTLAGLVLLLSLLWWGGPHVGLGSERLRLSIMGGVLLLSLLLWLTRLLVVRRRSERFKAELQASAGGSKPEIQELQQKMDAAVASLKSSSVGCRGSSALYSLPWFLIIGPAAAGKTTLLRNSGLHFPYAHGEDIDIKGFGGTRNCDWWFADEAVLLDTAGRYTTEEDDREEWFAFLGMLRKYRSRAPVNGVLVAVSLVDLLAADEAGIEWHVKIVRERLNELIRQLGCLFPVYLVVTKADLLHGFSSFFEDLGEHDRGQVWGGWLMEEEGRSDLAAVFARRLSELHSRLCELRLRKLSMQRNVQRKAEIFDFPAQFGAAAERLEKFFALLVKENPYQETPLFCGAYFTSGTQEGAPVQRLVGSLRQAFGFRDAPPPEGERIAARSFFIKKLFQDVIFPNSRGTIRNRKRDLLNRWLKGAWVTASFLGIAASVLVLSASFTSNALLARAGQEAVEKMENQLLSRESNEEKNFQAIRAVYDHYRRLLAYEERLPFHLMIGVYKGGDQIVPVRDALLEGLRNIFFRPAVTTLEYRLENFDRQWEAADGKGQEKLRDAYYQGLKTYLMLTDPARLSPGYASPLLCELWQENARRGREEFHMEGEDTETMEAMIAFYLSYLESDGDPPGMPPAARRESLTATARRHLKTLPDAQRLYGQIRSKEYVGLHDRTLDDLIKGGGAGVLEAGVKIPAIFTARGWHEHVAPQIREAALSVSRGDWVLVSDAGGEREGGEREGGEREGGSAEGTAKDSNVEGGSIDSEVVARLEAEIRCLYFADYAEAWLTFLEGTRPVAFTSLGDAAKKLQILSRSDGPLGELMRSVAANINLQEPSAPAAAAEGLLGSRVPELEEPFADLRKLVNPADKMTVSILLNQYLLAVSSVQNEIDRLAASADIPREASQYAARVLGGGGGDLEIYRSWVSASSLTNALEPRTRRIASTLLTGPVRNVWSSVLSQATRDLQQQWRNTVVATYARKLRGRFPFVERGSDAALADVADFFRPQDGVFWSFVRTNLAPFLAEGRGEWHPRTWLDMGPSFNRELLTAITRSQAISASLFRRGSQEPGVEFYLYPLPARGISETLLYINGQEYRYRNEPQEWRKFSWPGEADKLGALVSGVAGRSISRGELSSDGIWGLFHLLRQAKVTQENGTEYLSIWDLDGSTGIPVTVQFRIRADRENNLFDRRILADFDLPENIF